MRTGVLAFVLVAGCGDVEKLPVDAPGPDAYQPDAPKVCTASEMLCNGVCEDVMSSAAHCGSCDKQCNAIEGCIAGQCVVATASCKNIKALEPTAASGTYTNASDNSHFYCDFQGGNQYEFTLFNFQQVPATGFELMRQADYANPTTGPALIGVYNANGGLRPYMSWTSGNCCMSVASNLRFAINGSISFTFTGGGLGCGSYSTTTIYQFGNGSTSPYNPPLAPTFFSSNAVTEIAGCADGANPAIWMRKTPI